MWVQLRTVKTIEVNGVGRHYKPGDWVDVGRMVALRWIAEGVAHTPRPINELLPSGAGAWIDPLLSGMPFVSQIQGANLPIAPYLGSGPVPYPRTVFIGGDVHLRMTLLPVALNLLSKWELVVPLLSYDRLAVHLGSEDERAITKEAIRDLRVPVYEPRLMFMRRCRNADLLMRHWQAERQRGPNLHLSFMRALYQVKPQLCAAPVSWLDPQGH